MDTATTLYYIMDGCGNYYRLNNKEQLVVAESREDAEVFSFFDANQRIGGGKKAYFYNAIPVDEDDKAEKELEKAFGLAEPEREICTKVQPQKTVETDYKEKNIDTYDLSELDWSEYLSHFTYISKMIKKYHDELNQKLSDVDTEISDIMHYVELHELDDEQSIHTVELLHECRERRREVKDEMYRAECFKKALGDSTILAKVKESIKQLEKLKTRKYVPRKLTDLFENGIHKETRCEVTVSNHLQEEVTEFMERVRVETIFDEKENDWMSFAKEQMLFFGNARQYMINLELELERIDLEIENILFQIEDASCNVTQGYKVFKSLKDLRVERRKKAKELQCLEVITHGFDCAAMENAFKYSVGAITEIMEPIQEKNEEEVKEVRDNTTELAG